jgi:hypothetical protein
LAAEDETVRKETEKDGFGKVHYRLTVNAETLSSDVEGKTSEERGLYVCLDRGLRDLGDDSGHGGFVVEKVNNDETRLSQGQARNLSDNVKINK